MKTYVIVSALLLGATFTDGSAQSSSTNRVPRTVKTAFTNTYATARQVKWDREGKDWEVSFTLNGEKKSALFNPDGQQIELETEISVAKLPQSVRSYMDGQKKPIAEAAEITDAMGKRYYEAESGGKDYLFTAEGKPVKKIGQ